jgi:hypothetical protein
MFFSDLLILIFAFEAENRVIYLFIYICCLIIVKKKANRELHVEQHSSNVDHIPCRIIYSLQTGQTFPSLLVEISYTELPVILTSMEMTI